MYAVISVGKDNQYDHPNESVLSRLRDADVMLYRTDLQGDILCTSDGVSLRFYTQKGGQITTNPTESDATGSADSGVTEYAYIGHVDSKKFHSPDCSSLPAQENRIYFTSREEAIEKGYDPCGRCKP